MHIHVYTLTVYLYIGFSQYKYINSWTNGPQRTGNDIIELL